MIISGWISFLLPSINNLCPANSCVCAGGEAQFRLWEAPVCVGPSFGHMLFIFLKCFNFFKGSDFFALGTAQSGACAPSQVLGPEKGGVELAF